MTQEHTAMVEGWCVWEVPWGRSSLCSHSTREAVQHLSVKIITYFHDPYWLLSHNEPSL